MIVAELKNENMAMNISIFVFVLMLKQTLLNIVLSRNKIGNKTYVGWDFGVAHEFFLFFILKEVGSGRWGVLQIQT